MSTKTITVKKPSVRPVYKDMVISVMKNANKKNISRVAITKEIKENFSVNAVKHDKLTKHCLKELIKEGKIVIAKGVGVAGSMKLSNSILESEGKKKRKAASAKKPAAKKPTAAPSTPKKAAAPAKKPPPAKRTSPKKPASAKPKAKDAPKKKPAANRATTKPAAKAKKSPVKKPKTPRKAAPKKK